MKYPHLYAGRSEQHKERVIQFDDRKVLKFSSVYGANASGKTNLIRAIEAGKMIVTQTLKGKNFQDLYCKSKRINKDMPSLFEYEFTIENKCYAYGFTANLAENTILSEWLYEMKGTSEHVIYERDVAKNQYYFDETIFESEENKEQFHYFMKDANRITSSLLLYELKRRKLDDKEFEIFSQVIDWFQNKLVVIYPKTKMGSSYFLFGSDNEQLIRILDYMDTGITNYGMRHINESAFKEYFANEKLAERFLQAPERSDKELVKSVISYGNTLFQIDFEKDEKSIAKLMFQHGEDECQYEYGEESDGTKRLIELLDVILIDDGERVFVIDELDRSLHPQMTIKFVETFLKFSKDKNTQLIISTHESNLMDLNILRRDEIWFAEKEQDNSTTLYTLDKFKIRYDKVIAKDYLMGRYGAVPVFKDFEYVWGRD